MKERIIRLTASGLFAVGVFLASSQASALSNGYGYVCYSYYESWASGYYGDYGALGVSFSSQPGCTGSYLGFGYLYSKNASASNSSSICELPEVGIGAMAQNLQRAAETGQKVYVYMCSLSAIQIRFIRFYSQ